MMQVSLRGKVGIVTGGGTGVGRALAEALLKAGADVAVTGRRQEPLDKFVSDMKGKGGSAIGVICDVCSMDQVNAAVQKVMAWKGRVDILVNNAGIYPPGFVTLMSEQEWVKVIDTNLNGPFRMAHACAPIMVKNRWGRIINVLSPSGVLGMAMVPAYGTSKGGLAAFTRHLASELGRFGITVNGLCPGVVATEMFVGFFTEETPKAMGTALPTGRPTTLEDLAGAVLLLASDAGSGMTGSTVYVDGGMSNCAAMPPQHVAVLQQALGSL